MFLCLKKHNHKSRLNSSITSSNEPFTDYSAHPPLTLRCPLYFQLFIIVPKGQGSYQRLPFCVTLQRYRDVSVERTELLLQLPHRFTIQANVNPTLVCAPVPLLHSNTYCILKSFQMNYRQGTYSNWYLFDFFLVKLVSIHIV